MDKTVEKLNAMGHKLGFLHQETLSETESAAMADGLAEGKPLPEGVFELIGGAFVRVHTTSLSEEDQQKYLQYQQTLYLKTIRNILVFFFVLAILSMFCSLIILLLSNSYAS